MTSKLHTLFALALVALFAAAANAGVFVPAGLGEGETYQLMFMTSGATTAESTDIATYNTFVQNAAAAGSKTAGATYNAVASTMTVGASTNAPVVGPVYNTNGDLLYSNYADFWNDSVVIGATPNYDENGAGGGDQWAWTGVGREFKLEGPATNEDFALGNYGDKVKATRGRAGVSGDWWLSYWNTATTTQSRMYGLSEQLIVRNGEGVPVVPEPASLALFGIGGLMMLRRRKA